MYFLRGPHTYKITPGYFGVITPGVIGVIEHGMFENQLLQGNYPVTRVIRNQDWNVDCGSSSDDDEDDRWCRDIFDYSD